MKESNSRIAVLKDVDEDVFIGFCEYAYTGTYVTPDHQEGVQVESSALVSNYTLKRNGLTVTYDEDIVTEPQSQYLVEEPEREPDPIQDAEPSSVATWYSSTSRGKKKKAMGY
jgi:hypothetical protein